MNNILKIMFVIELRLNIKEKIDNCQQWSIAETTTNRQTTFITNHRK